MPPQVDPTSGIPIMAPSQPSAVPLTQQAQYQQTPQQMHQSNLHNMLPKHQIQPQMMNTIHGPQMIYPHMQKSKLAVLLLGILVGALGAHNFYLGYNGKAISQLLISVLSVGILAFIPAIWGLIEVIVLVSNDNPTDANGIPLKD